MPVFDVEPNLDVLTLDEAYRTLNITNAAEKAAVADALAEVVTEASQYLDSICGPIVRREVTHVEFEPRPTGAIRLRVPPGSPTFTATIASVTEYASGVATVLTAEDVDTAGGYRWDPRLGVLLRRSSWSHTSWAPQEVVVVYTAGRFVDTASVSQRFKGACRKVLSHRWQARGSQSGFGTQGGDGLPFAGVPYLPAKLLEHLRVDLADELLLDTGLGLAIG